MAKQFLVPSPNKQAPQHRIYHGVVVGCDPAHLLFDIKYEDNDRETVRLRTLLSLLVDRHQIMAQEDCRAVGGKRRKTAEVPVAEEPACSTDQNDADLERNPNSLSGFAGGMEY